MENEVEISPLTGDDVLRASANVKNQNVIANCLYITNSVVGKMLGKDIGSEVGFDISKYIEVRLNAAIEEKTNAI